MAYVTRKRHLFSPALGTPLGFGNDLEEESPGLAEVGYWGRDQKDAYARAKKLFGMSREGHDQA